MRHGDRSTTGRRLKVGSVLALVLASAYTILSQTQKQAPVPAPQKQVALPQVSQKQIDDLKGQNARLQGRLAAVESSASEMENRLVKLEFAQESTKTAELDLSARTYQRLDTDTGWFMISVKDASSYLDGYRVTLEIGNPSSATYRGFKLKVKWNAKYDWTKFTNDSYEKWHAAIKEKEISFTDILIPAKWNRVDLLLSSTSADQLGYFQISMQTDTISLLGGS